MFCKNCGYGNNSNNNFCENCGEKLKTDIQVLETLETSETSETLETTNSKSNSPFKTFLFIILFIPCSIFYYFIITICIIFLGLFVLGEGFLILYWAFGIILLIPISGILSYKTLKKILF